MLTRAQVQEMRGVIEVNSQSLPLAFSALSDPGRFRIFKLLLKRSNLCVTDVANVLNISVPAASQQLKIIEMSGLVEKERNGQMICYAIKKENPIVRSLMKVVTSFGQ